MSAQLPAHIRDLLTAIADSLDVPLAHATADDEKAADLVRARATEVAIIVRSALSATDPVTVADCAAQLRGWTAERPIDYQPWRGIALDAEDDTTPAENTGNRCGGERP